MKFMEVKLKSLPEISIERPKYKISFKSLILFSYEACEHTDG